MPGSHTTRKQLPRGQNWPWWRLIICGSNQTLEGRSTVRLSRHVLNLRPREIHLDEPERVRPSETGLNVNFISSLFDRYSLTNSLDRLLARHPRAAELSLVTVLEALVVPADVVWRFGLWFFLKLFGEATAIGREVAADVREFRRLVWLVVGAPWRAVKLPRYAPHRVSGMWRQAAAFTVLAFIIVLPLKGIATLQYFSARGSQAYSMAQVAASDLATGGGLLMSGEPEAAAVRLESARQGFASARAELEVVPRQLLEVIGAVPGPQRSAQDAAHLLQASEAVSSAAGAAAQHWTRLIRDIEPADLKQEIAELLQASDEIQPHLRTAMQELGLVRPERLPDSVRASLTAIQDRLERLERAFADLFSVPLFLQEMLVADSPRTYVVLFQNNSELRPTGGFAGSLALIELKDGQVKSVEIPGGGPYDFQGSLKRTIRPPEPLRLVRGTWQLQDANWFFDFPSSAEKVLWFIRESGGPEADGVLALTADVVQQILRLSGPLEMPAYGKVITADNFLRETQEAVELDYDRSQNRPKQFIADLAPALLTKLMQMPPDDYGSLAAILNGSLTSRGIQLYLRDRNLESQTRTLGWAGEVKDSTADYLAIVRTNIGGGKTDAAMRERIRHDVNVATSGDITVQVSLTREHLGDPSDIFTSRRNVSYLRFYVPDGSTLLGTDGFTPPPSAYLKPVPAEAESDQDLSALEREVGWHSASGTRVTQEFGKTVFGNWLSLAPGERRTVTVTYRLPFSLRSSGTWQDLRRYSVLFQRQAGVASADFVSQLTLPEGFRLRWQESSSQLASYERRLEMRSDWTSDQYYGVVLEKTP